jgi:hypothetical protein
MDAKKALVMNAGLVYSVSTLALHRLLKAPDGGVGSWNIRAEQIEVTIR